MRVDGERWCVIWTLDFEKERLVWKATPEVLRQLVQWQRTEVRGGAVRV